MTSALRCLALGPALCKAITIPTIPSFGGAPHITNMAMSSSYSTSLENKVFLVTGSTDGIGRHTASRLAEAGATVLVHGRREATVRDAVKFVKSKGSEVSRVDGFVADISTLRGMNKLCDDVLSRTDRLDCLINNAGVYQEDLRHSDDGVEYTFAVNVLAPYVITGRLLDLIAKAPDGARVVNVASQVAAYSADFDNLQFEKGGYNGHAAYALSKLLDIMFNAELSRRAPRGVTCNSLHPGVVNTKMLREGWGGGGSRVTSANDQFHLATSEDVKDTTGKFFTNRRTSTPPPPAKDKAACARLWGILESISGFKYNM